MSRSNATAKYQQGIRQAEKVVDENNICVFDNEQIKKYMLSKRYRTETEITAKVSEVEITQHSQSHFLSSQIFN